MTDLFERPALHDPPSGPSRSAAHRQRRAAKQRKKRRRRTAIVVVAVLVVVGGAGYFLYQNLDSIFGFVRPVETKDFDGPGEEDITVQIDTGMTGTEMGQALYDAGVVASVKAFVDAFNANPAASGIQPGTHSLETKMKASDAVARLASAESKSDYKMTIPEGYTVEQILKRAESITGITQAQFTEAMKDVAATGLPAEANGNYEGWLFPTTYDLSPDDTATTIIQRMVSQTNLQLEKAGVAPADREKILNIASLIEREAKDDADRPTMSRAIQNRLDAGMPLQIDAAVAYGAKKSGTKLSTADMKDETNLYNVYVLKGLPPTPIANPGQKSINAAMHPADGNWLFWCTVNPQTGETKFTADYLEHQQNVAELRQWEKDHPATSSPTP